MTLKVRANRMKVYFRNSMKPKLQKNEIFMKNKLTPEQWYKIIETMVLALLTSCAIALGMTSCKVWRTVSTTSTYTQKADSTQQSATITTKTVEEYQGIKKN